MFYIILRISAQIQLDGCKWTRCHLLNFIMPSANVPVPFNAHFYYPNESGDYKKNNETSCKYDKEENPVDWQ